MIAGSKLYLCPYAVHRNSRLWPQPTRFDPGRFLDGSSHESQRYAYFPFGGGPRVCIGESLATAEILTVLATVLGRYRLTLLPGQAVVPAAGLTLGPRDGLMMRAERRPV
jgi:cytochrome P450